MKSVLRGPIYQGKIMCVDAMLLLRNKGHFLSNVMYDRHVCPSTVTVNLFKCPKNKRPRGLPPRLRMSQYVWFFRDNTSPP